MITFFTIPVRGIDVSEFNGMIDWQKVERVDFCAIRVGHGRVTDKKFKVNWAGAKGKIHRIPYWYMDYYSNHQQETSAYGISDPDWGRIQAEKYWELVKNDPSGIVFLDIESASVADFKIQQVKERVLTVARAFLARADELSGKVNGIYVSLSMTDWLPAEFRHRPLWVAWYTEAQARESVLAAVKARGWTGKCLIWQYASHGDLDGDGLGDGERLGMQYDFLDLNMWLGTPLEYQEWIGGNMSIYPKLKHPLKSEIRISQLFGKNPDKYTTSKGHNGIDWATPVGTPVYAMQDGTVIRAMDYSQPGMTDGKIGYGRHVRIQHPQGVSIYGHFSRLDVKEGDRVTAGTQLGLSGGAKTDPNSGMSTGPHLHAEYRMDGIKNPVPGGYAYNAIDILPLLEAWEEPAPVEPEKPLVIGKAKTLVRLNIRRTPGGAVWATAPVGEVMDVLELKQVGAVTWARVGWRQWAASGMNGIDYLENI